ncbi:MAG TPA: peptide MFS transporter [Pyrinomonadaceae bacterium]|nr:peptide MFS transporter [Pyrinomonadaceae bacterium]HRK48976.1 peptide MFS transporter [Pyrinomonadaceae bacterium]
MSSNAATFNAASDAAGHDKHPPGLYALFGTEMWERFSFYSMLALFTLYLRDPTEGFGWTASEATSLYANYLMFVYASPLIGGFIADRFTGYRKAVMIGGFFFMAGHGLLSIPAVWAVYLALTCLVIGNGFFKPNVSTMVGNLYPEGSHLKDRAYNIFYMGINVGAMLAPIVMEVVRAYFGFHAAFAVAAFGMVISVAILWKFKNIVEDPNALADRQTARANRAAGIVETPAEIEHVDDGGDAAKARNKQSLMDTVPDWKRVAALIVIFLIVIVFWMVFHQNGSTLTYWADDNTAWNVTGTISNAINPMWIIILTFPLVWFWGFLDKRGKEPSTPTKMAFGMLLTGLSFFVLWYAATLGEGKTYTAAEMQGGSFRINERVVNNLKAEGMSAETLEKVMAAKTDEGKNLIDDVKFSPETDKATGVKTEGSDRLIAAIDKVAPGEGSKYKDSILKHAYLFQVSPFWLLLAYGILSLGELMLSPMGLSLVSKVAPIRMRGLMMGGWFVATAIGNKLTMIGIYWSIWYQSKFFIVLGCMALFMAVVLALLLKPLKKAMPGV